MKEQFDGIIEHMVEKGVFLEEAVEFLEKGLIARALESTRGNRSAASKKLGIHRNTLQRKLNGYGMEAKSRRKPAARETRAKVKRKAV